jgi:mRNA-decapping enzyme subunit 2
MSTLSESKSSIPQTNHPGTKKDPPIPVLPPSAFSFKDASMDIVLEDLSSRFILNLPDAELMTAERVCFQVEQA